MRKAHTIWQKKGGKEIANLRLRVYPSKVEIIMKESRCETLMCFLIKSVSAGNWAAMKGIAY